MSGPAEVSLAESPGRILILGVDSLGRILQCDRNAEQLLDQKADELLGAHLSDILVGGRQATLERLLDAVRTGREATAALGVAGRTGDRHDAIISVRPMSGAPMAAPDVLAALAIVSLTAPAGRRFHDRAAMRRAMLDDSLAWTGAILDPEQMAQGLMSILVPHFCNSGGLLMLESRVAADEFAADEFAADEPENSRLLRRMAMRHDEDGPGWNTTFPTGELLHCPEGTAYAECMQIGQPIRLELDRIGAHRIAEVWRRRHLADLLSGASMLLLPLVSDGGTLGFFVCTREIRYRPFDDQDVEMGMQFASRAAIYIDNARRYSRERATALTLQRSLLPTGLSAPSTVEVHHRYLPGSRLMEVGGDWYESIALPGGRVALVIGDVAGHGVHAAVTMGRLRTAIHTLAGLELPPAEALQRLDEQMQCLGRREPHFATCAYAVYDAVSGIVEIASAGHLQPLLAPPGAEAEFLDVPTAPPLGVGSLGTRTGPIVSREFTVEDGSLLVLYTDGLVEDRTRDIDEGLLRLRGVFGPGAADHSLEDLCQLALDGVYSEHRRDDIAVLIARLGRLPEDAHITWELPAVPSAVREGRALLRERIARWGMAELSFTTELLATELLTNAVRHAGGRMALALVREERALVCEVYDTSDAMPRLRHPELEVAETGRGLHVVGRLSKRWGVRRTIAGKVVWFELALP